MKSRAAVEGPRTAKASLVVGFVLVTAGLVLAGIWTDVIGYSAALLPTDSPAPTVATSTAYGWGGFAMALALIAFARPMQRHLTWLMWLAAVLMASATNMLLMAYHQDILDPNAYAAVGAFVGGTCYSFFVIPFYILLARHLHAGATAAAITLSLVGELVLSTFISTSISSNAQWLVSIAAPLVAAVCYSGSSLAFGAADAASAAGIEGAAAPAGTAGAAPLPSRAPTAHPGGLGRILGNTPPSLVLCTVLICIASQLIRCLSNVGVWGKVRENFAGMNTLSLAELAVVSALVVALAGATFIIPKRPSLQARSVVGLLIVAAGLQLLALSNDFGFGAIFDTVTTSCELYSHLLIWMIFIECVLRTDMPPLRICGLMGVVSNVCSFLLQAFSAFADSATSIAVMAFMYVLVFILALPFLFLLAGRQPNQRPAGRWRPFGASPGTDIETGRGIDGDGVRHPFPAVDPSLVTAFGDAHGLSPRETQILGLILANKTRSEIEAETSLAEGTVRTHATKLYRKLGVHSRAECQDAFRRETAVEAGAVGGANAAGGESVAGEPQATGVPTHSNLAKP